MPRREARRVQLQAARLLPSCGARRIAEAVALLVDEVLPARPLRQWVLSLPYALRFLLQRAGLTRATGATGAVTLVQRFGSAWSSRTWRTPGLPATGRRDSASRRKPRPAHQDHCASGIEQGGRFESTIRQVTLAEDPALPPATRETIAVIEAQMHRLRRVVEDMLTLAHADTGSYSATLAPFYLDEVVEESVRAGRVLGKARDVEVRLASHSLGLTILADEGLIRQLLLILLDNAVKYTSPGGRVDVALSRRDGGYRIEIADTGVGIPPEDQPHIFDRFYRVDKSRARSRPGAGSGAGLGLSIARWIAGLHGGEVLLEQSGGSGSRFAILRPDRAEA